MNNWGNAYFMGFNITLMNLKVQHFLWRDHNFPANSKLDMQVSVNGAENEADAAKVARSVASSSLAKA